MLFLHLLLEVAGGAAAAVLVVGVATEDGQGVEYDRHHKGDPAKMQLASRNGSQGRKELRFRSGFGAGTEPDRPAECSGEGVARGNVPGEGGEGDAGLQRAVPAGQVVADGGAGEDGERDEAGEPEEHGERVEREDDELVPDALVDARGRDLEADHQEGPDGAEEDVGELRGREAVVAVHAEVVDHVGAGAEHDDGEEQLHAAQAEGDGVEHHGDGGRG